MVRVRCSWVLASLGTLIAGGLLACASSSDSASSSILQAGPEALAFDQSARESGVPRDLLVAIAVVEEGLDLPKMREVANEVEIPAAGPLMLRHGRFNSLARGAELVGVSEHTLRSDTDLALRAGALVLAELGQQAATKVTAHDLTTYGPTLEELSGLDDTPHRKEYAAHVFQVLARGGSFVGRDGETLTIEPHDLPPTLVLPVDTQLNALALPEYPGAEVFPIPASKQSGKLSLGRNGGSVQFVVIHDTEGGWVGSVATLQNDPGKSVQYIIDKNGHIGQFMSEDDTAYHTGNRYYNERSIGIEHVGFKNVLYPEAQYAASAKLTAALAAKYKITADRIHVIGHDQIPDGTRIPAASAACPQSPKACVASGNYGGANNHEDPGIWEWPTYMVRFDGNAKCNDVTARWTCSQVTQQAFRCLTGGSVEVIDCDLGCSASDAGTDDVCKRSATPDAGPKTDGGADASNDASAPSDAGSASLNADSSGCGCKVTSQAHDRAQSRFLIASGLIALVALRRRRAAGAPSSRQSAQ